MTAVIIPKGFANKLAKAIATALEADSDADVKEVITEMIGELKPAPAGKAKKAKKPVDKDMIKAIGDKPKRDPTAYNIFCSERREQMKEAVEAGEEEKLAFGDITKVVAAEWKELNDEEKEPYTTKAAKAKKANVKVHAAYEKKLKAYLAKKKNGSDDDASAASGDESEDAPKPKGKKAPVKAKSTPKSKAKAPVKAKKVESDNEDEADEELDSAGKPSGLHYSKMKVVDLKALVKKRGLNTKLTKKDDLIEELTSNEGEKADASAASEDEASSEDTPVPKAKATKGKAKDSVREIAKKRKDAIAEEEQDEPESEKDEEVEASEE